MPRRTRERGEREKQRVAVGRALRHVIGADDAGARRAVLDHEALPEALAQMLRQDARDQVGSTAGRERHHDAHSPCGVFLGAERGAHRQKNDCQERPAHG